VNDGGAAVPLKRHTWKIDVTPELRENGKENEKGIGKALLHVELAAAYERSPAATDYIPGCGDRAASETFRPWPDFKPDPKVFEGSST
jgi:hypothetical protein